MTLSENTALVRRLVVCLRTPLRWASLEEQLGRSVDHVPAGGDHRGTGGDRPALHALHAAGVQLVVCIIDPGEDPGALTHSRS